MDTIPDWMKSLDPDDLTFIRNFVLASGSLKKVADQYGVTYPTVRLRLDRLIQRIQVSEESSSEPYVALIKKLAVDEKIDLATAKLLISEYRSQQGENGGKK